MSNLQISEKKLILISCHKLSEFQKKLQTFRNDVRFILKYHNVVFLIELISSSI